MRVGPLIYHGGWLPLIKVGPQDKGIFLIRIFGGRCLPDVYQGVERANFYFGGWR